MSETLTERFRTRFVEVARDRIRAALAAVEDQGPPDLPRAASELHTLAGEAGALGYSSVMELARRAERRLRVGPEDRDATAECAAILRQIGEEVESIASRRSAPSTSSSSR
jgi:HPt (histidine-containing phosphotransfer) domain-containing protein